MKRRPRAAAPPVPAIPLRRGAAELGPAAFGAFVREHRPRRERMIQLYILAGLTYFAFAAAIAFGFWRWYFAYANYGPAVVWRWASPYWAAGVALFTLGSVQSFRAFQIARRSLYLYSGGIVWRVGRHARSLPWADVAEIYTAPVRYGLFGLVWGTRLRVTIVPSRGRHIRLTEDLADLDTLLQNIKHSVYPRLLAQSRQAFNAGAALPFGPLTLQRDGILRRASLIPWRAVRRADLDAGRLAITFAENDRLGRLRLSVSQIPNADLCLQLIQTLGKLA
ncbi:MAG: DUF6585 family protein [Anaerolineales bacterium]